METPRRLVIFLLLLFVGGTVTLGVIDANDDGSPDTVQVKVNTARGDAQPTRTIEAPAEGVRKAAGGLEQDLESSQLPFKPATDSQLERTAKVQANVKPLPEAGAVQGFDGCVTRILPVNYSSRNGARASEFVLHYTVSFNVFGWGDVNSIVALFSNAARQASSNFVIDSEGHCAYIVPIEAKAWTQAGGNPWSISVEVIAFGNEPAYLGDAGWAKLRSVARQVHNRTGIPLRRGAVSSSCTPIRSGIVQHKDFGLCGGGHVDITPFSVDAVIRQVTGPATTLTASELKVVKGARHPKGTGHTHRYWCRRVGTALARIRAGDGHRRPARRAILRRVWIASCA